MTLSASLLPSLPVSTEILSLLPAAQARCVVLSASAAALPHVEAAGERDRGRKALAGFVQPLKRGLGLTESQFCKVLMPSLASALDKPQQANVPKRSSVPELGQGQRYGSELY